MGTSELFVEPEVIRIFHFRLVLNEEPSQFCDLYTTVLNWAS